MFVPLRNSLLSLLYPQECSVCLSHVENADDGIACDQCWKSTRIFSGSEMLCSKCGAFFNESGANINIRCHKCDNHNYNRAVATGIYEKALAVCLLHLKREPVLPNRLVRAIRPALERAGLTSATVVIPIPLSKKRLIERGFNQAEIIGTIVAHELNIPLDRASVERLGHTPIHRAGMDHKAREMSVKNVFQVQRPKLIAGKNILLVDDIFTSGATASHCAKILKKNGADEVNIFTIARAVLH